jgi:hypothetical protein
MLDGGLAKNIFALYDGVLTAANATNQINFTVSTPKDFTVPTNQIVLGFETVATSGGSFDPAAVKVYDANNNLITPTASSTDIGHVPGESLDLLKLAANTPYHLVVSGMNGTVGSYEVRTFLAGDVDGNRSVNTVDGKAILNLIQTGKYQIEADANLDHAISSIDYAQWRLNIADQTSLNPMPLSEGIVAATVSLPGG